MLVYSQFWFGFFHLGTGYFFPSVGLDKPTQDHQEKNKEQLFSRLILMIDVFCRYEAKLQTVGHC